MDVGRTYCVGEDVHGAEVGLGGLCGGGAAVGGFLEGLGGGVEGASLKGA